MLKSNHFLIDVAFDLYAESPKLLGQREDPFPCVCFLVFKSEASLVCF